MEKKEQTKLFSELVNEADRQVKDTLERLSAFSTEAATEAAQIARKDTISEIKEVEEKILLAISNSANNLLTECQATRNQVVELQNNLISIHEMLKAQSVMLKSLWIVLGIILLLIILIAFR